MFSQYFSSLDDGMYPVVRRLQLWIHVRKILFNCSCGNQELVQSLLLRWRSSQRDRFDAGRLQRDKFDGGYSVISGIGSPGSATKLTSVKSSRDELVAVADPATAMEFHL